MFPAPEGNAVLLVIEQMTDFSVEYALTVVLAVGK
jgi:hypothetical protein